MVNGALQYGAVSVGAAGGNFSQIGLKEVLLEPIKGLGTGYQYIRLADNMADRYARVATLATMLSASAGTALTADPTTNVAIGGAVAAKIAYMREIIRTRGGSSQPQILPSKYVSISSLKDFKIIVDSPTVPVSSITVPVSNVHPYCAEFTAQSKEIIRKEIIHKEIVHNMFQEQAMRRFLGASSRRVIYAAPITSIPLNVTAVIGWTALGVGVVCFTTLGTLYLFQRAERKRYQNQNDISVSVRDK